MRNFQENESFQISICIRDEHFPYSLLDPFRTYQKSISIIKNPFRFFMSRFDKNGSDKLSVILEMS